jgi:hypothetical protein
MLLLGLAQRRIRVRGELARVANQATKRMGVARHGPGHCAHPSHQFNFLDAMIRVL